MRSGIGAPCKKVPHGDEGRVPGPGGHAQQTQRVASVSTHAPISLIPVPFVSYIPISLYSSSVTRDVPKKALLQLGSYSC